MPPKRKTASPKESSANPGLEANLTQAASAPTDDRLSRGRTRETARFTAAPALAGLPDSYSVTFEEIKSHLQQSRLRSVLASNVMLIAAYWQIGHIILSRQQDQKWGAKVIDRLAAELRKAFPGMKGLSTRNLLSMKLLAREFPFSPIAQQPVAQLPWGHVFQLMQRLKDPVARDFYIQQKTNPPSAFSCARGKQVGRRVCPQWSGAIHRRRRLENPTYRDSSSRVPRQPAHHRGN